MSIMSDTASNVTEAISAYCRAAINSNLCTEDTCEFCPMNKAYEIARKTAASGNSESALEEKGIDMDEFYANNDEGKGIMLHMVGLKVQDYISFFEDENFAWFDDFYEEIAEELETINVSIEDFIEATDANKRSIIEKAGFDIHDYLPLFNYNQN